MSISILHDTLKICPTSSHSAPAVRSATRVWEMLRRRAMIAVWSTNLSAPNWSKKRADTRKTMSTEMISHCNIGDR